MNKIFLAATITALAATAAAAETSFCQFDRVMWTDQTIEEADWAVRIDHNNGAAQISLIGGGSYTGKIAARNRGTEIVFATATSIETMTVSPSGETQWMIDFQDGRKMAYFGTCGAFNGVE